MIIEWIRESNLIEGVDETEEDARSLRAWRWFLRQPLDLWTILELHRKIMRVKLGPRAGKWRTVNVRVGPHICPEWQHVPNLITKWAAAHIHANTEAKIKTAHIRFEGVHPFVDGNGRTGRMIMNYQRVKAGLEPLCILADERWAYYKWFESNAAGRVGE